MQNLSVLFQSSGEASINYFEDCIDSCVFLSIHGIVKEYVIIDMILVYIYMYLLILLPYPITKNIFTSSFQILKMSSPSRRNWLLVERDDDFRTVRRSDPKEYFAGVRREWAYRCEESESLRNDLIALGAPVIDRDSFAMYPDGYIRARSWTEYKEQVIKAVEHIRMENNRMLLRRSRYYMYELAKDSVSASGRELSEVEKCHLLQNPKYLSDDYMSDEGEMSYEEESEEDSDE